jgi:hypothetical protein
MGPISASGNGFRAISMVSGATLCKAYLLELDESLRARQRPRRVTYFTPGKWGHRSATEKRA